MQKELTGTPQLLEKRGELANFGWGRGIQANFTKKELGLKAYKLQEWDTYYVQNEECRAVFTLAGTGMSVCMVVCLMETSKNRACTSKQVKPMITGPIPFPPHSKAGDIVFATARAGLTFVKSATERFIKSEVLDFFEGVNLTANLTLDQAGQEGFTDIIPLSEPGSFLYNQKIGCMSVSGTIRFGGTEYKFKPEDSFGYLDWGRSMLPPGFKRNHCYVMGWVDGMPFAVSLGYGYNDNQSITENYIMYQGVCHKLEKTLFEIPQNNASPWYIVTSDSRLRLKFFPEIWAGSDSIAGPYGVQGTIVCGKFLGKVILDDGTILDIGALSGFARLERQK